MTFEELKKLHPAATLDTWHLHPNGGGWIENTAWVSGDAWVCGNARVSGNAQVYGDIRVANVLRSNRVNAPRPAGARRRRRRSTNEIRIRANHLKLTRRSTKLPIYSGIPNPIRPTKNLKTFRI